MKPLSLAQTGPFAHYGQLASLQREKAYQEALPNVRRLLEVSAERWETLAREYETTGGAGGLRLVSRPAPPPVACELRVGALALDCAGKEATLNCVPLPLTQSEFAVLELLARSEEVVSKRAIYGQLHRGKKAESRLVDVFVCKLRKKLAAAYPNHTFIETVRGVGYYLVRPSEQRQAA